MVVGYCIFLAVCLALVAAFIAVRVKKGACPLSLILKTFASLTFVFGAIFALLKNGLSTVTMLFAFGLIFAMVGDIVLELKVIYESHSKTYLNFGIILFSLSSICYAVASILLWKDMKGFTLLICGSLVIAASIAVIIWLLEKPMKLNYSSFRIQICIYSFFVSLAAVLGLSIAVFVNGYFVFAIGALLVLISDLFLCHSYFGSPKHPLTLATLNHALYYIGELLIMSYLFFILF